MFLIGSHSVSYLFFDYRLPSSSLCKVFDGISSNMMRFSQWTHRLKYMSLETFFVSNNLPQMISFSTWPPNLDSHSPALLDLFISSNASICSTMAFSPLKNPDHVVVSVSIDWPSNSKTDAPFHYQAYDYFRAGWDVLWEMFHGGYIWTWYFCCWYGILWVGPVWNCCTYTAS